MQTFKKAAENTALENAVNELFLQAKWLGTEIYQFWDDALDFLLEADKIEDDSADGFKERERLLRAAVLASAAGFEAWTNHLSLRLIESGQPMTEAEKDFLQEKRRVIEKGVVKDRNQIRSARERFFLLFRLVGGGQTAGQEMLSKLEVAFELRDSLVHPKPGRVVRLSDENRGFEGLWGFLFAEIALAAAFQKHVLHVACAANVAGHVGNALRTA